MFSMLPLSPKLSLLAPQVCQHRFTWTIGLCLILNRHPVHRFSPSFYFWTDCVVSCGLILLFSVLTQTLFNVPSVFYGQCSASVSFFVEEAGLYWCSLFFVAQSLTWLSYLAFYFQLCITHSVLSASTPSLWVQWISKGFVLVVRFVDDHTAISRFNHLKHLLDILYSHLSHIVSAILHQQVLTTQTE